MKTGGQGQGVREPKLQGTQRRHEGAVELVGRVRGEKGSLRDERLPPGGHRLRRAPREAPGVPPRTGTAPGVPGARGAAGEHGNEPRRRRPLALGGRKRTRRL